MQGASWTAPTRAGRRLRVVLVGTVFFSLGASSLPVFPSEPGAANDGTSGKAGGWVRTPTGEGTRCALGSPYSFFHREGTDPAKLLIYFQGGGACWNWVSCSGMFDPSVDDDELGDYAGIFDAGNPENPFREFAIVFIPYCTGDVHVGDTLRSYGDDPDAAPVAHRGYRNVTAVLDRLSAWDRQPDTVVVVGASAGAYGALFHAPAVARRFPRARIVMIGDSGVPLLHDPPAVLETWNGISSLRRIWKHEPSDNAASHPLREAYRQAALEGSRLRTAQITSNHDAIQGAFYLISGSHEWRTATYALLEEARRIDPTFRSFLVEGADHGLLPTHRFYEYAADGVRLRDWIAGLVGGEKVDDVRCATCNLEASGGEGPAAERGAGTR
jgi:hypothetical protein